MERKIALLCITQLKTHFRRKNSRKYINECKIFIIFCMNCFTKMYRFILSFLSKFPCMTILTLMWPHMGCVWEIPWQKRYNHVSGCRLSPRSKNPKISGILKFGYIFHFFRTELTSKNPKTLPIEFLVKKWSILM